MKFDVFEPAKGHFGTTNIDCPWANDNALFTAEPLISRLKYAQSGLAVVIPKLIECVHQGTTNVYNVRWQPGWCNSACGASKAFPLARRKVSTFKSPSKSPLLGNECNYSWHDFHQGLRTTRHVSPLNSVTNARQINCSVTNVTP